MNYLENLITTDLRYLISGIIVISILADVLYIIN